MTSRVEGLSSRNVHDVDGIVRNNALLPALILRADHQANIVEVNTLWTSYADASTQDLLGRGCERFMHADDRERFFHDILNAATGSQVSECEFRLIGRQDRSWWFCGSLNTERDDRGRPRGAVGVFIEQTVRKQREAKNASLSAIVETADDAIISKTLDGTILTWNSSAERLFGHTADQAVGQSIQLIVPPSHRAEIDGILARVARGERITQYETSRIHRDGRRVDISLTVSPIVDQHGKVIGASAIARDMTRTTQQYAHIQRLSAIVESSSDAIISCTIEGMITSWNGGAERVHGYTSEQACGQTMDLIVPSDRRSEMNAILSRVRKGERIEQHETVQLRADGTRVDVSLTISPIINQAREVIGVAAISRDVTLQQRAERALTESEERFRHAIREAPFPIMLHDDTGKVLVVNREWSRISGYDHHEIRTVDTWLKRSASQAPPMLKEDVDRLFKEGERQDLGEHTIVTQNGENRTWVMSSAPLGTVQGRRQIVTSAMDITKRKLTEESLRQSKDRLDLLHDIDRSILSEIAPHEIVAMVLPRLHQLIPCQYTSLAMASGDGMIMKVVAALGRGATGAPLSTGSSFPVDTGALPFASAGGRAHAVVDLTDPNAICISHPFADALRAQGQRYVLALALRIADKVEGMLCISAASLDIIEDRYCAVAREVVAQLTVAYTHHRVRNHLLETTRSLRVITELDHIIAGSNDVDDIFEHVVKSLIQLIDLDRAALVVLLPGADQAEIIAQWSRREPLIRSGNRMKVVGSVIEHVLKTRSPMVEYDLGESSEWAENDWLREQGVASRILFPMFVKDKPIGLMAIASYTHRLYTDRDLDLLRPIVDQIAIAVTKSYMHSELESRVVDRTADLSRRVNEVEQLNITMGELLRDLRSTNKRLHTTAGELHELNAELEMYASSVSHDLRAPLRSIRGFGDILVRRFGEQLNEQGRHYLSNIIESSKRMDELIEDLLRFARLGRRGVVFVNLPLAQIIDVARQNLGTRLNEVDLVVPRQLPTLRADKSLLAEIITNLLDNAIKYVAPGVRPKVAISIRSSEFGEIVEIRDNGIGIPDEHLDKVFDVFQRLHPAEAYPGTGIGLTIVKKAVRLLEGRVWLESKVNEGTSVYLELQRAPNENA